MAEVVAEEKVLDVAAHLQARNAADQARRDGKTVEPAKPTVETTPPIVIEEKKPETVHVPRSVRRQMNGLLKEVGELRGRLSVYEDKGETKVTKIVPDADPEPQRNTFPSDAEYNRALGRWDARQEAKKEIGKVTEASTQKEQEQAWEKHVTKMGEKAAEDRKLLKDWDEVAKAAQGEDAPEFTPADHPTFAAMLAESDVQAFVLYHFAKHPLEFKAMLELTSDTAAQIRAFHRLEGKLEKMYTPTEKQEAAPASGDTKGQKPEVKPKEDRIHPADAATTAGRTAVDRDVHKPKPSAEVGGHGGSTPPEEPAVGSRAWMERRNQGQFGRR